MNYSEIINSATISLKANKGRTALTMLGVIIGVFSVVALVALGRGIENYVSDEFDELGTNLLFISPGEVDIAGDPGEYLTRNKLGEKHVKLLNTFANDHIKVLTPYLLIGETAKYKTNEYFSEIVGVDYRSMGTLKYELAEGRNFTKVEERSKAKVAVIGPIIKEELFGLQDPLGKKIKMGGDSYEVVGTFKEKGANYNDQIILPYTSALESFDIEVYSSIVAEIDSAENIDKAKRQFELALLRDLKEEDFTVLSQQELLDSIQEILGALTLGLGAIAGISLVVGGIGIMNIMLVSVTERIHEIGLRKAVGATSGAIGFQFLFEAIFISVVGGAIGLALGFTASFAAQSFIRAEVPLYAVFLAFFFSVAVGMVFGTYPAYSASKLDPIEALRYE